MIDIVRYAFESELLVYVVSIVLSVYTRAGPGKTYRKLKYDDAVQVWLDGRVIRVPHYENDNSTQRDYVILLRPHPPRCRATM